MQECFICGIENIKSFEEPDFWTYRCPQCGKVNCTLEFYRSIYGKLSDDQKVNARGWIRENEGYILQIQDVEFIKNIPTPTVEERANKLLLYWSKKWPRPSHLIKIFSLLDNQTQMEHLGKTYSVNQAEFSYLVTEYLRNYKKYIRHNDGSEAYQITPQGWGRIATLQAPNSESNIVFVAMRFNDEMKKIYSDVIRPAILNCGFEPLIMFERNHINKIDDEIVAGIKKSRFIIADFTKQNQGAYYETGFARGLGLRVISTCEKKEVKKLHFDTRQYRTILWEKEKPDTFKKELQDCIEANIGKGKNKPK